MKVALLVLTMAVTCQFGSARQIILNEDELIGTCTESCDDIPTLYKKAGCTKISGCSLNSEGWNRGFVRCDYCECSCTESSPKKDVVVVSERISSNEDRLYGTCTGTCDKSGLVRTNSHGCQEVRDCFKASSGWNRGFVRCDYCTCTCINRKYANKYALKNIEYDLSEAAFDQSSPVTLGSTEVINEHTTEQEVEQGVEFSFRQEKSITSSHSLEVGLELSVDAGSTTGKAAGLSSSMAASITRRWETTNTRMNSTEKKDSLVVKIKVPGKSSILATVSARRMKIDVPYTATLVTTFPDKSTSSKRVSGIFTNVDFTSFKVRYGAAKKLPA